MLLQAVLALSVSIFTSSQSLTDELRTGGAGMVAEVGGLGAVVAALFWLACTYVHHAVITKKANSLEWGIVFFCSVS